MNPSVQTTSCFQTTLLLSAALDREGSIRLSHGANVFAIDGPCPLLKICGTAGNRGARAAGSALPHPVASFREDGRTANDTRDVGAMSVERALSETETHLTG